MSIFVAYLLSVISTFLVLIDLYFLGVGHQEVDVLLDSHSLTVEEYAHLHEYKEPVEEADHADEGGDHIAQAQHSLHSLVEKAKNSSGNADVLYLHLCHLIRSTLMMQVGKQQLSDLLVGCLLGGIDDLLALLDAQPCDIGIC